MSMTSLLFVYGTLRRRSPHPMARFLARRARFVGEARVPGRLYDLGRYPGMTPSERENEWVHGDLYDLGVDSATLAELDGYENAESPQPAFFDRQSAEVTLADGAAAAAWVYWWRGPVDETRRIVSGDYASVARG
jgi:gamma-glutamylcyclotransferase (GGCT)/AIG2-like uncharacterized protein YtfP